MLKEQDKIPFNILFERKRICPFIFGVNMC